MCFCPHQIFDRECLLEKIHVRGIGLPPGGELLRLSAAPQSLFAGPGALSDYPQPPLFAFRAALLDELPGGQAQPQA